MLRGKLRALQNLIGDARSVCDIVIPSALASARPGLLVPYSITSSSRAIRSCRANSITALFPVCSGLVFELLHRRSKLFERGGVLRTHLFRWLATRIGMLDGVEHRAGERQRCAA